MSPTAKAFGEHVQAGRYEQACTLLTPESQARFEAAEGCAKSIPATVNSRFAAQLANVKFSCADIGVDTAVLRGDGGPAVGYRSCNNVPRVFFKRVGERWLIDLSPQGVGAVTPRAGGGAAKRAPGKAVADCVAAAGNDITKIKACVTK
jgi:hypothetical protein